MVVVEYIRMNRKIKTQKTFRYLKGVTLIELLVVIAIIGIMTSVTIVSLSGARTNKALETAAREVASVVREEQNNALTGKNLDANSQCGIDWADSSSDYSARCPDRSYTLDGGVRFSGAGSVAFSAPFAGTSDSSIVLSNSDGSKTVRVCVYSSGKIEETAVGASCPANP
jgi:prepilin-type N-terminal cleavage/methylation domain-containing protein